MKARKELRVEDMVPIKEWGLSARLKTQLKKIEPVYQDFGTETHWKPFILLGPILRKMCESEIDREYVELVLKVYWIFQNKRNLNIMSQETAKSDLDLLPTTL